MNIVGYFADFFMALGVLTIFILGVMTLVPARLWPLGKNREKKCFLGYSAHCPMAPISSILTLGFAYFFYWFGFVLR